MVADFVFAGGTALLGLFLLRDVRDRAKRFARSVSVTYALVFTSFLIVQGLAHLHLAMLPTALTATAWTFVAWKRAPVPRVDAAADKAVAETSA